MGLSLRRRFKILQRDHFMCLYCGRRPPEVELDVDHVQSRANGGSDDPSNLITACKECNQGKSAKNVQHCASCVRPLCRGPLNPRDGLEATCTCRCHACRECFESNCEGARPGGFCVTSIVSEEEMAHDVAVEEGFTE